MINISWVRDQWCHLWSCSTLSYSDSTNLQLLDDSDIVKASDHLCMIHIAVKMIPTGNWLFMFPVISNFVKFPVSELESYWMLWEHGRCEQSWWQQSPQVYHAIIPSNASAHPLFFNTHSSCLVWHLNSIQNHNQW